MFNQAPCITANILRFAWYASMLDDDYREYKDHYDNCEICQANHEIRDQVAQRQNLRPDFDELLEQWDIETIDAMKEAAV